MQIIIDWQNCTGGLSDSSTASSPDNGTSSAHAVCALPNKVLLLSYKFLIHTYMAVFLSTYIILGFVFNLLRHFINNERPEIYIEYESVNLQILVSNA